MALYMAPRFNESPFTCPYCNTLAQQHFCVLSFDLHTPIKPTALDLSPIFEPVVMRVSGC
jgi:hypothetical protein